MHHEDSWSHPGLSIWLSLYPRQIIHAIVIHLVGSYHVDPMLTIYLCFIANVVQDVVAMYSRSNVILQISQLYLLQCIAL